MNMRSEYTVYRIIFMNVLEQSKDMWDGHHGQFNNPTLWR